MSTEAPRETDTEPRNISNLDNIHNLAEYEQKVSDLETRRLEDLDRNALLKDMVASLQAKLLALEKEKEDAVANCESKSIAYNEIAQKLHHLEADKSLAVDKEANQEEKLAELEAKNKALELKIQKNNAQKQAFADQFDKLEEQLAQSQAQAKVLNEKIAILESSGTRDKYAKLEEQFRDLMDEKISMAERLQAFEDAAPSIGVLTQSKNQIDCLQKKIDELEKSKSEEHSKSVHTAQTIAASEVSNQSLIQSLKEQNVELQEQIAIKERKFIELSETYESHKKETTCQSEKFKALIERFESLEKEFEREKVISRGLQDTIASNFDSDLREKEQHIHNLAALNTELQITRQSLMKEKLNAEELKEKLKNTTESSELTQKLSEANAKILNLDTELETANAHFSTSNTQVQSLNLKLVHAETKINDLTSQIENYNDEKRLLQEDIKALDRKVAEYVSKLNSYENKDSELSTKNSSSLENLKSIEASSEVEKSFLEQKLTKMEIEKKDALAKVQELEKKLNAIENPSLVSKKFLADNGEVKPSVSTIKNALQQKVAENASPQSRYKGLVRKVTKLENRFPEESNRASASEDHRRELNSVESTQELANDLAKKLALLQTEKKINLDKIQILEQNLGYAESKLSAMGHKLTETELRKNQAIETAQFLEKKIIDLEERLDNLPKNYESEFATKTEAETKTELQELIVELNAEILEKRKTIEEENAELAKLKEGTSEVFKSLERQNLDLNAQLLKMQSSIAEQSTVPIDFHQKLLTLEGEKSAAVERADMLQSFITTKLKLEQEVLDEYKPIEELVMDLQSTNIQLLGKVKRLLSV